MARDITTTPLVSALDYLLGIKDGRVSRLAGDDVGGSGSVEGIEAIPGGIAVGAADRLYLAVNADGFWITSNARWDGAAWQRINTGKWAFGLNIRTLQLLPFEAATGGVIFWKCPPGANPINPTYVAADGWQNGFIMTEFGDLVIGGFGIEIDGSGTFPYGRLVHYSNAGAGPHLTGILTNLFLDFAAVDDASKPSWFFGREDDGFIVARGAAAATGVGSLINLLVLTAAGDLDAATLRATGGFLRLAAGSNVAGLSADASYLYAKDPAGTNRLIIGKAGVDNRVLVDLQNDSDAALVVRNSSGVAKFSIDATGAMTGGAVPMARFSDVSAFAKTLLDDADAAAARATLGVGEGGEGGPALPGFRNRIINGDFQIWQWGKSFADTAGPRYTADRWRPDSVGTSYAVSRQAFTPGQTDVPGNPRWCYRLVVNSAAGADNYCLLGQRIEDVRSFAGEEVTISVYGKADAAATAAVTLKQYFGSGGGATGPVYTHVDTVTLGTTFARHTLTTTVPSIAGKTLGSGGNDFLEVRLLVDAGTSAGADFGNIGQRSGTYDISRVQVEAAAEATEFEWRPRQVEHDLCRRYFQKSYNLEVDPGTAEGSWADVDGALGGLAPLQTNFNTCGNAYLMPRMRAVPTVTLFNPETGSTTNPIAADTEVNHPARCELIGESGFTVYIDNSSSGPASLIYVHWTADAEL